MTATSLTPGQAAAPKTKEAKQAKQPKEAKKPKANAKEQAPAVPPELMDLFTRQTDAEQRVNMFAEHKAQLESQRALSQGRIAAMMMQVQSQLFTIWNEVWMQRQKVQDDSFKSWLKLLTA